MLKAKFECKELILPHILFYQSQVLSTTESIQTLNDFFER